MARKKHQKYQEIKNQPLVAEARLELKKEGRPKASIVESSRFWQFLDHSMPSLSLELACGYGEYSLNLAQKKPDHNFIGVDIKGDRLWQGAQKAKIEKLKNIYFLRLDIGFLADIFPACSISEIWLTYPDPQPKKPRARLTHPKYLEIYQLLLKPKTQLKLVTDSSELVEYTEETMLNNPNFQLQIKINNQDQPKLFSSLTYSTKTRYQNKFESQGKASHYLEYIFQPKT